MPCLAGLYRFLAVMLDFIPWRKRLRNLCSFLSVLCNLQHQWMLNSISGSSKPLIPTDEQLQQLLSALTLELQSRQAHRASREQELRESMVRQWQRCPVRCVQHCSECEQRCCFSSSHPEDFSSTIKQGITAAVTIGAVKQPGNL